MPIDYQVIIYDTSGSRVAVLGLEADIRSIVIEKRVNYADTLQFGVYGQSYIIPLLETDCLIQVKRCWPEAGIDWYTEFIGFHRTPQSQITTGNSLIFTSYARGLLDLVSRRSIRYYADTNGSAKGPDNADNIIKEYVYENAGALATVANGRVRSGVTTGLTVAADTGQAASIETANAWDNLLQAIRSIGEPNMVDFDVVWGGESDVLSFVFTTYYPYLGTDRRSGTADPFVFTDTAGNMQNIYFTQQRTEEITSALVLGPGEGPDRDVTLVEDAAEIAASPWNLCELDVNASGEDRAAALTEIGNQTLYEKRAKESVSFQPIQTEHSAWGKDYFLGDLVTARSNIYDITADVKIRAATIQLSGGEDGQGETISLELEEVPAGV